MTYDIEFYNSVLKLIIDFLSEHDYTTEIALGEVLNLADEITLLHKKKGEK